MAAIGGGPPGCMGATTRNPNSSTASVAQLVASVTYTPTASWYASTSGRTILSCVKPPSTKGADLFRGCGISLWSASPPDPVHCEGVSGCENRRLTEGYSPENGGVSWPAPSVVKRHAHREPLVYLS